VVAPPSGAVTKLNVGAQLQTCRPIQSTKTVSILQRLHGEVISTNSAIQKLNIQ